MNTNGSGSAQYSKDTSALGKRRVLIFGATGLLGGRLVPQLIDDAHEVVTVGRSEANDLVIDNITADTLRRAVEDADPDTVINLIAATNVDACETDPQTAYRLNAQIPADLSTALADINKPTAHLIHISSDQVYSGPGPHTEDRPSPVNVYGKSKLAGEQAIEWHRSTILRTNFFGRSANPIRHSFSDWIVQNLRDGKLFTLFNDVWFSALHISTLSKTISALIRQPVAGTYNVGTSTSITKAEFAIELARQLDLSTEGVRIGSVGEQRLYAMRPNDMTLMVGRLEQELSLTCPAMSQEITLTAQEYRQCGAQRHR